MDSGWMIGVSADEAAARLERSELEGDPGPAEHLSEPAFTAAELPRLMCIRDGRGRMTVLIQLAKDWACAPHWRDAMIADPPRRRRWHHRFTPRRRDLARIAAVVHALCDRDAHPLPEWVLQHRSDRPIHIDGRRVTGSGWDQHIMRVAPDACAYHDVWFDPESIQDIRVHGVTQPPPPRGPNPSD